ncbi:MAG: bifunctional glutamate N-acetyltransferase/amino-acid acetyltransferase ArgJ, partial [Pseudothermotoga sp.]
AEKLGLEDKTVLVSSTGVIGVQLPIEKIESGIERAVNLLTDDPIQFAEAIVTTDTAIKISYRELELSGKNVRILGIAKGSGMIHPNLATMLSFLFTDVKISYDALKKLLENAVDKSYNMIDVDGDTSTNDTVIVLANGLAENKEIVEGTRDYEDFRSAFDEINVELAKKIVEDGEGATKLIQVEVINAADEKTARKIARSIVSSNLVKTAIYGEDANWGRIIAAAGYSGANFDVEQLTLCLSDGYRKIRVFEKGQGIYFDEEMAKQILSSTRVFLTIDLNCGNSRAVAWGCDLTEKYVQINGRYRT